MLTSYLDGLLCMKERDASLAFVFFIPKQNLISYVLCALISCWQWLLTNHTCLSSDVWGALNVRFCVLFLLHSVRRGIQTFHCVGIQWIIIFLRLLTCLLRDSWGISEQSNNVLKCLLGKFSKWIFLNI